jgi:hypothetical protein
MSNVFSEAHNYHFVSERHSVRNRTASYWSDISSCLDSEVTAFGPDGQSKHSFLCHKMALEHAQHHIWNGYRG